MHIILLSSLPFNIASEVHSDHERYRYHDIQLVLIPLLLLHLLLSLTIRVT
jgi:hypothetical protein